MTLTCTSYPLSKLKKVQIRNIHHPPKEWLQGMQHLTSLQEFNIYNCSGLEETLDWHNIAHVPNVNKDGESLWDEDHWNNFSLILQVCTFPAMHFFYLPSLLFSLHLKFCNVFPFRKFVIGMQKVNVLTDFMKSVYIELQDLGCRGIVGKRVRNN
ncbi:hypothetical protein LINPERPRIM_LOCUS13919 [Linum perenne]